MGCLSRRKKQTRYFVDQKWDYIHLDDFKSKGCGTGFAYVYLWFSLFLSIAVYIVDTFTAVQLLAFNRWSSKIEPAIKLSISKWIFSVCIILSFVNLAFEGFRAYRVIRRGNIAECYMDSLAVRWESVRLGSGQGWRRFLVFTELTKSKKGAHYIALFTYFNFQAWIRVIFCSGPRQVVNALTLRSVYLAKLAVNSDTVEGSITSFFHNLELLAEEDFRQAAILSGMLFTLVIWIFSALQLILAVLFFVFFLFHWIPSSDGGLTGYCERKVNKALLRIVTAHVNKALAKGQAETLKAVAIRKQMLRPLNTSKPTLPNVGLPSPQGGTLPPAYSSRPTTARTWSDGTDWEQPVYPHDGFPAPLPRYSSRAPLVPSAADMGFEGPDPLSMRGKFPGPVPARSTTNSSHTSLGPRVEMANLGSSRGPVLRPDLTESPTLMDKDTVPAWQFTNHYGLSDHYNVSPAEDSHIQSQDSYRQLTRSITNRAPISTSAPRPVQRTMTAPMLSQTQTRGHHDTQHIQPSNAFDGRPPMPHHALSSDDYDVGSQHGSRPRR